MTRLDEILKRCEAATPGPWEKNGTGTYVAMMQILDDRITKYVSAPQSGICLSEGDLEFIAHARTDLPLVVKALQKAVEYIKGDDCMCEKPEHTCTKCETLAEITAMLGEGK